MLIFWRIRYLDRNDKQFKDRDLFLDTTLLPPATKAAVELAVEANVHRSGRDFLRFRSLFNEQSVADIGQEKIEVAGKCKMFALTDYFEDESGKEITDQEMGPILTGSPTARLIPSGAKQHDIDYMLAEPKPLPVAEVSLSSEDVRVLGYFSRDFQELSTSAFMRDGPGSVTSGGTLPSLPYGDYHLQTSVTDDEIRSFVMIFRRLYMKDEPANFQKAVAVFAKAIGNHPLARWAERRI